MAYKYFILQTPDGEQAVIFPEEFYHDEVANAFDGYEVLSAGFTGISEKDELVCFGKSESFKIESRGEADAFLLKHRLRVRDQ